METLPSPYAWPSIHGATMRNTAAFPGCTDTDDYIAHRNGQRRDFHSIVQPEPSYVWITPEQSLEKDVSMVDLDAQIECKAMAKPAQWDSSHGDGAVETTRCTSWQASEQGFEQQYRAEEVNLVGIAVASYTYFAMRQMLDYPMDET